MPKNEKRAIWLTMAAIVGIVGALGFVAAGTNNQEPVAEAPPQPPEVYRLVQAIGNDEKVVETGLTTQDCEEKRDELKATAEALGTFNEQTGFGSITCLPESD